LVKPNLIRRSVVPITPSATEWPTVILIALNWLAFFALTWFYHSIPWWLVLPLGAYILTLFGSLQHEVLHGHPTSNPILNESLIFPNIALWTPYTIYKSTHLKHHVNEQLTDPQLDPESYYITTEKWLRHPSWIKAYYRFYNTYVGRFFWGPVHVIAMLWISEIRTIFSGNIQAMRPWVIHAFACLPVFYWVVIVCRIPLWQYAVLFVYSSISLTLLRSFVEHQAVENVAERSIIVETNPLVSLMYLNNNLHAIHHKDPHLAWFRIPWIWQNDRSGVLTENGHYYFKGYRSIIFRYWKTPKEQPNHPL